MSSDRQQDDSALRLLRMAAPRLATGGAATDAWLFEVRAFLKTAALPPSAPPALDEEALTAWARSEVTRAAAAEQYQPEDRDYHVGWGAAMSTLLIRLSEQDR